MSSKMPENDGFSSIKGCFRLNQSHAAAKLIQSAQKVSTAHLGSSLGAINGNILKFIIKGNARSGAIKISHEELNKEKRFTCFSRLHFE